MNLMQLFVAVPAAFFILGNAVAIAGQTVDVAGAIACRTEVHGGLRRKVRVHARQKLEGRRDLH